MNAPCKICGSSTVHFGRQRVLAQHDAEYRRCGKCGYVFVVDPHWLEQAYSTAIAALDTGIVTRNLWLADASCALLGLSLRGVRKSLDFGGGTGLFVRLMRDRGHDFSWYDAYSPNLLARGFEASLQDRFDLLTAFELVEHLVDPVPTFEHFRSLAPVIVVSTELLPEAKRGLDDWWYYAPESGQHIGFFTRASLATLAERLGLQLSSNGRNLHVLSPRGVSDLLLRALRKPAQARWLARAGMRGSLAHRDAALLQHRLQKGD
jgi:ribosomal protein S27AE